MQPDDTRFGASIVSGVMVLGWLFGAYAETSSRSWFSDDHIAPTSKPTQDALDSVLAGMNF